MGIGSDHSSVRSWLVQPIKELSSAAGRRAGRERLAFIIIITRHTFCPIATSTMNELFL